MLPTKGHAPQLPMHQFFLRTYIDYGYYCVVFFVDPDGRKSSRSSKHPKRESRMSLTAYERRRRLQSLQKKARHPMEMKKELNFRKCQELDKRVQAYLQSFITKPDDLVTF